MNLSNWMSDLSEDVKANKNITQIAIPGSHDCGTYSLDKSLPVGPDEADILQSLGNNPILGPTLVKPIMYRWSTTQRSSIADQLSRGIRYFDIRVGKLEARPKGDVQYRLLHGLYGAELFSIMDDMKSFLDEHVNEIVILDFQHVFSCSDSDHRTIIKRIESTFGSKLLEQSKEIPSLKEMQDAQKQVIVIYGPYSDSYDYLWPRVFCLSPWANTMDLSLLLKFLLKHMTKRPKNCLYVTQAVLTPNVKTILFKPFSTLFKQEKNVRETLPNWLQTEASKCNPNIVMADFVADYDIPSVIVALNQ